MKSQLTGKIRIDGHVVIFTSDGFRFTFVRVDDYRDADGRYSKFVLRADKVGYVWGVTSDQKVIAVYIKEDREIYHSLVTNTWNYIIIECLPNGKADGISDERPMLDSVSLLQKDSDELSQLFRFNRIEFLNGSVRSVNPCNALHENFDLEKRIADFDNQPESDHAHGLLVYDVVDDSKKFTIDIDGDVTIWRFGSTVSWRNDINKGEVLANDTSSLIIEFNSDQTLETFYDYYGYVSDILAFLTYRRNIFYESIKLLTMHPDYGVASYAECYVNFTRPASVRDMVRVVSVKLFTDEMFKKLVVSSQAKSKDCAGLPTSVIPQDDDDAIMMNADKVRRICSALESEINATGVKSVYNEELDSLINKVKDVIKAHRKQSDKEHKLPDKTYDNIFSSISHWSDPAADRFVRAWHENEDLNLTTGWNIIVYDRDIEEFVNVRNRITHSGQGELTEKIANTGIALSALTYSLALQRIGVDKEYIREIMERGLIG